jgi:hypothetical protein
LSAAHDLVLAVQQRLMAGNPRSTLPRTHPGRACGQPVMARIKGGGRWKFLSLPAPNSSAEADWLGLVEATIERALDRWAYAQHQAIQAAREQRGTEVALATARAAWRNYWDLSVEAERLRLRLATPKARSGQQPLAAVASCGPGPRRRP